MLRLDKFREKLFDKVGKILLRLQILPEPLGRLDGVFLEQHRSASIGAVAALSRRPSNLSRQHIWLAFRLRRLIMLRNLRHAGIFIVSHDGFPPPRPRTPPMLGRRAYHPPHRPGRLENSLSRRPPGRESRSQKP